MIPSVRNAAPPKRSLTVDRINYPLRQLYIIESAPCFIQEAREHVLLLMTEEEAETTQLSRPDIIVRLAEGMEAEVYDIVIE